MLDAAALRVWLVSDEVVDPSGNVWSWRPDGYRYAEAAGLWLSWVATTASDHPRAVTVATSLEGALDTPIGRDGIGYTFDLGVVLGGLLRYARARRSSPSDACTRAASRLASAIVEQRATTHGTAPARWSSGFGPHQRKLAVTLALVDRAGILDTQAARDALRRVPAIDATHDYVHATAYALEGAWALGDRDVLARGAAWLAEIQDESGGIRAHGTHGPVRADATAQAIRLWCAHDRRRWSGAIERGLERLGALVDPQGGVRYADDCDHRNVWCTLFAWQAAWFAERGVVLEDLL